MKVLKFKKVLVMFASILLLIVGLSFPVLSKVFDTKRLQETNFELSILEFRGENLSSELNPARAFFKYGEKMIELKILNKDFDVRIVLELPRFPTSIGAHFLDGKLLISGGDIPESNPQVFPILLVRQPTANTRLEKINKIIADANNLPESSLSKQVGQLITRLQNKYKYKYDFATDMRSMNDTFEELYFEIRDLNIAFDSTLEELEDIDKALTEVLHDKSSKQNA